MERKENPDKPNSPKHSSKTAESHQLKKIPSKV